MDVNRLISYKYLTFSESGPPRNVTTLIDNTLSANYNATLLVTWLLPCDINGELKNFAWELDGHSKEGETDKRTDTIEGYPEDDTYSLMIPNLKPGFNYTITIAAYTGIDPIQGEVFTENFSSPDGCT